MVTMTRQWLRLVLAGIALGTLLLAGCASVAKSDPRVSAPSVPSPTKSFEPSAWSTKRISEEKRISQEISQEKAGETGSPSVVSGAVPAVGAVRMSTLFAERRASESLDRLAGVATIRHEKRGDVITLPSDRLVDSGEWTLTSSGQYNLRELVAGLRDQDGRAIRIQGYTDSMGTPAVNDALSLRRAEAVRDFLITQGVAAESMRAEGLGAKRPVAHNGTADGRAQNRRIEIVIAPLE
jgi:outer membrane protein OmpA-like peptidoglycan-associated protein